MVSQEKVTGFREGKGRVGGRERERERERRREGGRREVDDKLHKHISH